MSCSWNCPHEAHSVFFPSTLIPSTCTDKNRCDLHWAQRRSKVHTFPICVSRVVRPIFFPEAIHQKADHADFVQEKPLVLQTYSNVLVFVWVAVLSIAVGHGTVSNLINLGASEMRTWVHAETASSASPALPGSFEIVSRKLAVATWEADAPCSTALYSLLLLLTLSLREHHSSFVLQEMFRTVPNASTGKDLQEMQRRTDRPIFSCLWNDFRLSLYILEVPS